MKQIYLDNAATTPILPVVIDTIAAAMVSVSGNPSSIHQVGRKAKTMVETARKNIAKQLNVTASELVFTAGGSEANNLILRNAITNLGVTTIISSKIEHHAVLHTIEHLQKEFNCNVQWVALEANGQVDFKHLEQLLSQNNSKKLVSLMTVNNETGNLLDLQKTASLCTTYNALFHTDAVQAVGHFKLDLQAIPIDFLVASAHKFHGPKGVGFAYIKKGFGIAPLLHGGEQERGARAGTENVHSILGMEKALSLALENVAKDTAYIQQLKTFFIEGLKEAFPTIQFNGTSESATASSYAILNVRFPKEYSMLLFQLDLKGIAVSGGSACQSGSNKGSHVLHTILPEEEATKTSVRFSFSQLNTLEEITTVLIILKELIK
jgi:cysteine desulfurase